MNRITVIGNLTRDPEKGTTPSGVNYCRFTVAARRKFKKGDQDTDFIRVTAWRGLGDTCAQYLSKGKKVAVEGTPDVTAWIANDGTARGGMEVTADDVEFLSPKGQEGAPDEPPEDAPY